MPDLPPPTPRFTSLRLPVSWQLGDGRELSLGCRRMFARGAAIKLGALGRAALLLIVGAFVVGTIGLVATAMARSGGIGSEEGVAFVTAMGSMFGTGLLLLLAVRAACLVTLEKERDCWDSLLTTPLAGRQVIGAKVLGNLYACRWLVLVLLGLWSMGIVMVPSYAVVIPINLATVLILGLFVTCVGLLFSLWMSTSLRAMSATLATVFVIGGGYLFCCCMLAIVGVGGEEFMFVACVPFLLAAPSVMMQESIGEVAKFVGIYAFGMCLYLIATALCYAVAENRFDELAGRIWLTKSPPPEKQVAEQDAPSAS